MKKTFSMISALVLTLGSTWALSADRTSGNPAANPAPAAAPAAPGDSSYSPSGTPGTTGSASDARPLPADWKKVKGTVQSADPAMNQVKIKDDAGNLSLVNVDSSVVIRKDGKKVQIADLQAGDRIIITRKITPATEQNKG